MLQFQMRLSRLVYALLVLPSAASAFTYSESVNGDLSGNRTAPTALIAAEGSNTLIGTTVSGDVEYVRITLPSGTRLTSLVLNSVTSIDDNAFIAVQQGTTFTVSPATATESDLLGYTHFGTGALSGTATPGNDILDNMGVGPGAIGFVPPLTGSDYTFWIQQFNAQSFGYSFNFVVAPEPHSGLLLSAAMIGLGFTRRRGRRA